MPKNEAATAVKIAELEFRYAEAIEKADQSKKRAFMRARDRIIERLQNSLGVELETPIKRGDWTRERLVSELENAFAATFSALAATPFESRTKEGFDARRVSMPFIAGIQPLDSKPESTIDVNVLENLDDETQTYLTTTGYKHILPANEILKLPGVIP